MMEIALVVFFIILLIAIIICGFTDFYEDCDCDDYWEDYED